MRNTSLAAVMFVDIADFHEYLNRDEHGAIEALTAYRTLAESLAADHGGEIVDATGSELLVLFTSAVACVQCALHLDLAIRARNAGLDPQARLFPRIGLHLGEIWRDEKRIYGNGVNVTARIMQAAIPGALLASEDIVRQVDNKMDLSSVELPQLALKNIERHLKLFALNDAGAAMASNAAGVAGDDDSLDGSRIPDKDGYSQEVLDATDEDFLKFEEKLRGEPAGAPEYEAEPGEGRDLPPLASSFPSAAPFPPPAPSMPPRSLRKKLASELKAEIRREMLGEEGLGNPGPGGSGEGSTVYSKISSEKIKIVLEEIFKEAFGKDGKRSLNISFDDTPDKKDEREEKSLSIAEQLEGARKSIRKGIRGLLLALAAGGAFSWYWLQNHSPWLLAGAIAFGALPALSGIGRILKAAADRARLKRLLDNGKGRNT